MDLDQAIQAKEGTGKEYNLKCKVKVVQHSFKEIDDGRVHETKSVFLVPDFEATESQMFLTAWLPDVSKVCMDCGCDYVRVEAEECPKCESKRVKLEWSECPSFISYPVNSPARLAVLRKNNLCSDHHLMVMSSGAEQDLIHMDGKEVRVKIFPASEDEMCDSASSINRTAKGGI